MVVLRQTNNQDWSMISKMCDNFDSPMVRALYTTWQQQGNLYMAEQERTPIGFCCLAFPASTEAQFMGIRLLPEFNKESVGQRLIISLLHAVQERGCNTVRMLTSTENWETQAALQRNLGFERQGTWNIGYKEKLRQKDRYGTPLQPACYDSLDDIWHFLQYSAVYKDSAGLIFHSDYFFSSFTKAYLAKLLRQGQVFVTLEDGLIGGVAIAHQQQNTLVLNYLDALPSVLLDLLQGVICAFSDCEYITSAIPTDCYAQARPFLEQVVEEHQPDKWLILEKEVLPLALPRD